MKLENLKIHPKKYFPKIRAALILVFWGFFSYLAWAVLPEKPSAEKWGRFLGPFRTQDARMEILEKEFRLQVASLIESKCNLCHVAQSEMPWILRLPVLHAWTQEAQLKGIRAFSFEAPNLWGRGVGQTLNELGKWQKILKSKHPPLFYRMTMGERGSLSSLEVQYMQMFIHQAQELLEGQKPY